MSAMEVVFIRVSRWQFLVSQFTLTFFSLLLILLTLLTFLWKPLELECGLCSRTVVGRRVPVSGLLQQETVPTTVSPLIIVCSGSFKSGGLHGILASSLCNT